MRTTTRTWLVLVAASAAVPACVEAAATAATEQASRAAVADGWVPPTRFTYLAVRDLRKCRPPACGGWFVKRVDQPTSSYVVELELEPTGLDVATQQSLRKRAASEPSFDRSIVAFRGMVFDLIDLPGYQNLYVSAAWAGPTAEPEYRHLAKWWSFADDGPEVIAREIGTSVERAVWAWPPPPEGVDPTDTIAVGLRDEELLDVFYRFVRVR